MVAHAAHATHGATAHAAMVAHAAHATHGATAHAAHGATAHAAVVAHTAHATTHAAATLTPELVQDLLACTHHARDAHNLSAVLREKSNELVHGIVQIKARFSRVSK